MKLILQAIKALFRKLEAAVESVKASVEAMKPWCVQGDWEQNDPEAPDYMKGRTHWSKYTVSETVLYGPSTLETTIQDGYTVAHVYEGLSLNSSISHVCVVFDGTAYITKCVTMNNGYGIGNLSIIEASGITPECYPYGAEYDDTGEPFCFVDSQYYMPAKHFFSKDAGEHTIEVYEAFEELKRIDPKYIPRHKHDAASDLNGVVPVANGGTGSSTVNGAMVIMGRGLCDCRTAAATAEKTASLFGFTLPIGALVGVDFSFANTASKPTLNIGGTGAKYITNFSTNTYVASGDMGACLHLFMYDGVNWVLLNPLTQT